MIGLTSPGPHVIIAWQVQLSDTLHQHECRTALLLAELRSMEGDIADPNSFTYILTYMHACIHTYLRAYLLTDDFFFTCLLSGDIADMSEGSQFSLTTLLADLREERATSKSVSQPVDKSVRFN